MHESISEWWKKICRPTASFKEGWTVLTGTIVLAGLPFLLVCSSILEWWLQFRQLVMYIVGLVVFKE